MCIRDRGDTLLLYSDGVTDAHNEGDESYGLARLKSALQRVGGQGAQAAIDALALSLIHIS